MKSDAAPRWAIVTLAIVAAFAALKLASDIFAPVTLALVVGVVLSPVTDRLDRIGAPHLLGALFGLLLGLGVLFAIILGFGPLVGQAVDEAPRIWAELRDTMDWMKDLARGFDNMSDEVNRAIDPENTGATQNGEAKLGLPTLGDILFLAPGLVAQALLFAGTLFFFLLGRIEIYDWLSANTLPNTPITQSSNRLLCAERVVARYFLTISMINVTFGIFVAAMTYAVGLPSPVLWGLFAALMNYILYLGPAIVAVCLLVAGVIVFDGPIVVLPAGLFVLMNATEGQFVTPGLVGREMAVNPLLVFLSLVLGLWLWGPIGGLVAIPILMWSLVMFGLLNQDQTISSGRTGTGVPNSSAEATL
ncbi:AI-2E family transporter [Aliiroseovarius sp. YM-037]|uniref:AI-2E family transporter n=1 Tax=Aliiroseovarius sp. YM-037 TaxID=3341728 RepID=UPI003A8073A7